MRCYERSNYEVFIASNETMNKTQKPYIQKKKVLTKKGQKVVGLKNGLNNAPRRRSTLQ